MSAATIRELGETVVLSDGRRATSAISRPTMESLLYFADRSPPGAIVEVGVWKGGSALALSTLGRPLFLYDTFTGIPYQGPLDAGNPVGKFGDTSWEDVCRLIPEATVVKGLFPDSLVPMPPVSFVHADADQYESTAAILRVMPPLMVKGGFILFDDFGVGDCEGCTKAVYDSGRRFAVVSRTGKALVIV